MDKNPKHPLKKMAAKVNMADHEAAELAARNHKTKKHYE